MLISMVRCESSNKLKSYKHRGANLATTHILNGDNLLPADTLHAELMYLIYATNYTNVHKSYP